MLIAQSQHYNIGEKPTVILYTAGTDYNINKEHTMSL